MGCDSLVDANNELHILHLKMGYYLFGAIKMAESVLVVIMGSIGIEQEMTRDPKCLSLFRAVLNR